MSITSNSGIFGFGLQVAGLKDGAIATWYKHQSADIDLGIVDDVRLGPPEIGGIPTPTFPYKAGYVVGGGATIYPRLEEVIGWLLLSTLGDASVVPDEDIDGTAVVGMNAHTFNFLAGTNDFVPFVGFRKLIPHTTVASTLGQEFTNCKVTGLTLGFPNDGPISARIDALGIDWVLKEDPMNVATVWTFDNSYENWASIPVATAQHSAVGGHIKFDPGTPITLPVVGASMTLANIPLDIRQEKVYGSPKIHDVTILSKAASFDLLVKWDDPDLYQEILTGSSTGTEWTSDPFVGELEIVSLATGEVGSTGEPYKMRVKSAEVLLQQVGDVVLAANQAVMMRMSAQAIAPTAGEYVSVEIQNGISAEYALPA